MKKFLIPIFVLIAFFCSGCLNLPEKEPKLKLQLNNKDYLLELAKNQEQREKGLMNRKSLKENEGMIFYFEEADNLRFWMKNTYIPLQIIFINGCKIVDIQEMKVEENPQAPLETYVSKQKADKAIELNSNSIDENYLGKEVEELCINSVD